MKMSDIFYTTGFCLLIVAYMMKAESGKDLVTNYNIEIINYGSPEVMTLESVEELIKDSNIEHPEVVFAQVKIESAYLKSNLAKKNNNIFGMKHPGQRPTASLGERNGYAHYQNWRECIFDYAIWQSNNAKGLSKEEYYQLLGRVYASDSTYIVKLKSFENE